MIYIIDNHNLLILILFTDASSNESEPIIQTTELQVTTMTLDRKHIFQSIKSFLRSYNITMISKNDYNKIISTKDAQ